MSSFRADRDAVRALHTPGRFIEVQLATTLEVCASRDVKGLYGRSEFRAATGEEDLLTGVGQEYVAPETPELVLDGGVGASVEALAQQLVERLAIEAGRRST